MATKKENTTEDVVKTAEEKAAETIKAAEDAAAKILKETEEKIQKMLDNAQQSNAPVNVTIKQPDADKVELPDYIKQMQEDMKDKTDLKLFNDGDKYKDDVFVSVNGKYRYQIQRGPKVKVPKFIAEVEKLSRIQDLRTAEMMKAEADRSEKRLSEMR